MNRQWSKPVAQLVQTNFAGSNHENLVRPYFFPVAKVHCTHDCTKGCWLALPGGEVFRVRSRNVGYGMAYAYAIRRGYYAAETRKHEGSLSPRDGRCPIALRSRPGETVIYSQLYEDEHCAHSKGVRTTRKDEPTRTPLHHTSPRPSPHAASPMPRTRRPWDRLGPPRDR